MVKEERRIEILRAASRVFSVKGFERAKIEDIAKEAGIGKGTVYEYFDSKQQLFDEMVIYNGNLHINNIKTVLNTGSTFRDKFLALAKYQTQLLKEYIHVFNSMSYFKGMTQELGTLLLEQNIKAGEILKEVVQEAISQGELRPDLDAEIAASVMLGTLNQYCCRKVVFLNIEPKDLNYDQIVDTVLTGLGK